MGRFHVREIEMKKRPATVRRGDEHDGEPRRAFCAQGCGVAASRRDHGLLRAAAATDSNVYDLHATCGGGEGGASWPIPGESTGGKVRAKGSSSEKGGFSRRSSAGSISWRRFAKAVSSGESDLFCRASSCFASVILQQSSHGFSPLKVSTAAFAKPSVFE
jgi:hypothetical protein